MFLEQICPGQVNSYPQALHTFAFDQDRFVIYATGSKIVIYADPDKLIQTIVAEDLFQHHKEAEPITSVAGNCVTGQIALSYNNQVAILKPEQGRGKIEWHLESVLNVLFTVNCLDWSAHNTLLVAGTEIALWRFDKDASNWKVEYQCKPATQITFAKFEPKSHMFATIGKFDRLVTIWYPASTTDKHNSNYNCIFISHPKYVTHFVWRHLPSDNGTRENDCTLFTMARDGIGRFWSPTDLDQPHMLYMCAVIDSNQSLVTSEQDQSANDHINDGSDFSPIHYIGCDELASAVNIRFRSHSKHERFDQLVERIRDRIRDTPDLLFRIQADGSLTLWGVQHLNTTPRRIPRVYVVLRVDKAIDPLDAIYFLSPTFILHDYGHIQSSSTIKSIELSLLARNPYGQVRCYSLNLIDFLDSTSFSAKLHLKYTWLGHQHAIVKLYQTQKNRFCTIGIDGQMNVWKYELRESYGKMTTQLQLDCSLFIDSDKLLAVPIDKDKYLAVYDGHLLKLYEFGQHDCHLHQSRTLTSEGKNLEISSLHVYNIEDPETHETSFLLVGVSATSKTILNWHLVPDNSQLNVAFLGSKEMTWQSEPTMIVSASQWATNTASKLLYRLAMHKRTAFVILVDNVLFFYSISIANEEVEWETLYTLGVSCLKSPIQSIKFAPGVMAIVCGEEANILSIWTEMRSGSPPECSQLMTFDQSIQDLVWNVTSDAQYILAIAFPKRIEIFGQKRASGLDAVEESWTCYTKFEVNTPKSITALAWVDCGVLIAAAGNQLLSYLKWLTEDDTVNASIQSYKTSKLEPMTSIFDISYEMNGPLPFYHPYHLVHYTMWGKMDLVHNVLLSLYNFLKQFVDDEDNTISEFPTISLPTILKLQNDHEKKTRQKGGYGGLFDDSSDEFNDEDGDSTRHLTLNEAKNLAYSLKSKSLPGINEKEKMHLIAMVNTIVEITDQGESLDENGARFIALLENHFHLKQALAENEEQIDLAPKDYVWALHSQSQDLLLERCVRLCKDRFVWKDARSLGMFMWLQKIDVVREQMSQIARNTYLSKQDDRDPIDCTLFYFALRKKNLVQGLWNTTSHHKEQGIMKKFLANDFNDPRWQRAASKNAYALLGKQRFEYAAAFFLLADKLKDAVNVILKNVKDYQLAIAICRVYEGDHSLLLKEVLENTVIPVAIETNDCWLASIAFWLLNKQKEAVRSIVVPLSQFSEKHIDTSETDSAATVQNPNSFILYNHLKASLQQPNVVSYDVEYMFYLQVAQSYERLGCPLLALYVLTEYYMPPPPTFQSIAYEEEVKDEKESKPSLDRAEDLFSSSTPQNSSFASDIFADENDSLFKTNKPSYASNLFDESEDDIFASSNKQTSDNLFDEVEENTHSDKDSQKTEKNREYDGLDVYKAMLAIRMLQTFFHAATALYNGLGEISDVHEATYRDNFISNRNTLLDLGASLKIPADILSRLLMEKSIETDVFPLYLHILNEQVPENFDVHQFLRAFKVGCFEVNEVALMPQELDYATLAFVENWSSHVVKTFPIWSDLRSRYCNPKTASLMTHQIILTTYIGAILITLRERYYEKAWTFLCHFKFFLEALGSNDSLTATKNCLALLLKDEVRMAEIAPDEFEDFSDESMFGYDMHEEIYRPLIDSQDRAAGSNMLEIASLNFVLSSLEHSMQCQGRHNSLSEQLSDYTWTTLLDPIAYRIHYLKQTVLQQLENNTARHNVTKQFKTLRQKKFWRSIKSLSTFDRLLPFVDPSLPSINVLSVDDRIDYCRSVYHSTSTVYGFCLNPSMRDTMAICMKSEIQEIDLTKATDNTGAPLIRARSVSSFGLGPDHHVDSYPDTEEDDSDFEDSESLHAAKQTRRNRFPSSSKISSNNSPIVSPAGSRTFDEHVQRGLQNLNLDYLQDSLKKSFPKGVEAGRTPAATSPAVLDQAERESMISLRRPVTASCMETHPHYPFYITGCEGTNGGPSAILWQFGQEKEIASYYGCKNKTTRIHFDRFGQKFGAADASGSLCLWRFDAHAHSNKAYYTLQCHSKATRDFVFVNSSSLIATAGTSVTMSRKRDHVVLWDTLLPASKAMVCALPGHDGGAYAIAYEPDNQLLFSGGKKGEIVVSDLRQRTTMHTFTAHDSRIRSIAIDSENKSLITGSIDGELKIWDASTYKLHQTFEIQPRNRFLAPSFNRIPLKAFGVTQIQILSNDSNIYTSGPNGIIKCNRVPVIHSSLTT